MPIQDLVVQSYRTGITLDSNPYAFIQLVPPPDFHGDVQPVTMYFFQNATFSAYALGNNPYNFNYYVIASDQTLFNSLLEMLERPGTKHVSLDLQTDTPVSGNFDIPINWVGIGTDSLSAQSQKRTLPEKVQKQLAAVARAARAGT